MSDELRLPDDLAACEARLASQPLPTSSIDRDQLMYRAGWAACEVQLAEGAERPAHSGQAIKSPILSLRSRAATSAISSVLAASLAVAVTLNFRRAETTVAVQPQPPAATIVAETPRPRPITPLAWERSTPSLAQFKLIDNGYIALRRQAVANAWPYAPASSPSAGDAPTPSATTARELMRELLPATSDRSA